MRLAFHSTFFQRISSNPPESPCPTLSEFLNAAARVHPKIFFKPLFTCAAANKDATVVQQLKVLNALSRYMPDFWIKDPDMISIALTSAVAASKSTSNGTPPSKVRLGQLALTLEVLERVQSARKSKDLSEVSSVISPQSKSR